MAQPISQADHSANCGLANSCPATRAAATLTVLALALIHYAGNSLGLLVHKRSGLDIARTGVLTARILAGMVLN